MARNRKSKDSFVRALIAAPWWVSVVIAVTIWIICKAIIPATWASNPVLKGLSGAISGNAWIFSGAFLVIGLVAFFRQKADADRLRQVREISFDQKPVKNSEAKSAAMPTNAVAFTKNHEQPRLDPILLPIQAPANSPEQRPTEWSLDLIQEIEWKRFEDLCQKFYESKGIRSETTALGPDGGIDIRLFQDGSGQATSIVQCKAWGNKFVGVQPVRELLGVMTHEKIPKAFFMTSGRFSDDAKVIAQSNRITLIDGQMLLTMIKRLPEDKQSALLAFATNGDYRTPTCPSCGITMRRVEGKGGRPPFWGCHNYPKCRQKLGMRVTDR